MWQIAYKRSVLLPVVYPTFERAVEELRRLIEITKGFARFDEQDYKVIRADEKNCNKEV